MKKYFNSLLLASLLTTVVSAEVIVAPPAPVDDEFAKMNKYFNSLVESHFSNAKLNNFNYPRMDVKITPKEILLKFDLAGVAKENIQLSIDANNLLTLRGKKKKIEKESKKDFVKQEIFYGSFERDVQLPENIEQSKVATSFHNGILKVIIPRKEIKKPQPKIIPIK